MFNIGMAGPGVFVHATDATVEQLARMRAEGDHSVVSTIESRFVCSDDALMWHVKGDPSAWSDWTWSVR